MIGMQDKSSKIKPFGDETLPALANLRQHYDALIAARRSVRALPYNMRWRTVSGRDYLYLAGNGRSDTALGAVHFESARCVPRVGVLSATCGAVNET